LRWTRPLLSLILILFLGCELSEGVFENPLDREVASSNGISPPALVFYPDIITTNAGAGAPTSVYAMEIIGVGMAEIEINYDPNKVSVGSVAKGELFDGGNPPFFYYEDNSAGSLIIYVGYLGPNGNSISGTGNIANIIFVFPASMARSIRIPINCLKNKHHRPRYAARYLLDQ